MQQSSTLRRRKPSYPKPQSQPPSDQESPPPNLKPKLSSSTSSFKTILCLTLSIAIIFAVYAFSQHRIHSHPDPKHPFKLQNALRHLRVIAERPRWVSTNALEQSMQYIHSELEKQKPIALSNDILLDLHIFRSAPGSFSTSIADIELINSYSNLTNVVARLRPASLPLDTNVSALLVNAHVDSAVASPGASDNVAGVAIAMEILRSIASLNPQQDALQRPVIFLFNGAEEPVLPAAHSFITQHPWARSIAAHINLESIGPGGAYHLFRLGPNSPWLANAFADSVSVPLASVSSTDLFDAKIVPGETDFRVFSEFGNIPGFDFALLDNPYVYHTIYDDVNHVDPNGVQHGGITTFEVAMQLAGKADAIGAHLSSIETQSQSGFASWVSRFAKNPSQPRVVFFDVLHLTTIVYGEGIAYIFNMLTLLLTTVLWTFKLKTVRWGERLVCLRMTVIVVLALLAALFSATFASFVYTFVLGNQLRWYGSSITVLCLYLPPCLFGTISVLLLFLPKYLSKYRFEQMLFALSITHSISIAILTLNGFMTAYIPVILLWVCNICVIWSFHPIITHFLLIASHAVMGVRLNTSTLNVLLSILGRVKSTIVPHEVVAGLITTYVVWTTLLLPCLPLLCYYASGLRKVRMVVFLAAVAVVVWLKQSETSNPQTPYSIDAPKRIVAEHFYSPQHDPPSTVLIGGMDPILPDVQRIMPGYSTHADSRSSKSLPSSGSSHMNSLETIRPFERFMTEWWLFAVEDGINLPLPSANILHEEAVEGGGWNVTVRVDAEDCHQLTVRIPTGGDSPVKGWSINAELEHRKDGAWIRHVGSTNFEFWIWLVDTIDPSNRPEIRLVISSGRLGASRSSILHTLKFEEWEAPVLLVSTGLEIVI